MILSKRPLFIASALLALSLGSACGPFGYISRVASDASRAVANAEAAGAEELAPYEYWGSVAYLEQSKVMMAYSEYERSFDYGDRATQLAEAAKNKSDRTHKGVTVEHKEGVAAPDDMVDTQGNAKAGEGSAEASGSVGVSLGGDK